nr:uncharacterized protein LOC109171091 [Ipomoea trifida]
MVVPPTEQPGGTAPGGNGGGDEVLVSVRAEGHPTLPEGRGRGDRAARQPSAADPPGGRRQDIIVPRPSQTDVRGRHVSEDVSLEGEGESVYRPVERGREEGKPNSGNKPHAGPRMPPWAPVPPSGRAPHLVPFTPLRAPPSDILAYAEECQLVRTPDPRPDPSGADMSKYCKYHRCHGHNTNDCQAWRKEIERLIQAGMLGNFIDWDRMAKRDTRGRGATPHVQQTGKEKDRDEPNRPVASLGCIPVNKAIRWGQVSCTEATHEPARDGSTLPTAPEPPTGSDGKATDDVPPALSGLIRNPSAGVVVEVGMTGAGGRRRGRTLRGGQPISKQPRHTRTSVIISCAGKIFRPLPILYGTLQSTGMGDLLFLMFALEGGVSKLQICMGSLEGLQFLQRGLVGLLKFFGDAHRAPGAPLPRRHSLEKPPANAVEAQ